MTNSFSVRRQHLLLILILAIPMLLGIFCKMDQPIKAEKAKVNFKNQVLVLQQTLDRELQSAIAKRDPAATKKAFLQLRSEYKWIEYYIEYFFPSTAVMLNGAPIDEIELGENLVESPTGLQVMEELIYNDAFAENKAELLNEVKKMRLNLERVLRFNEQYTLTDAQLFDAARLEIFRITSLGISGFDTPAALQSIPEAGSALWGIKQLMSLYGDDETNNLIEKAITYLSRNPDFNQFDRLAFITGYLQPASKAINNLRKKLEINTTASGSTLRDDAIDLFEVQAFNLNGFVGNATAYISKEKILLGKKLFNDPILSNQGNRSCASCHHEGKAFSDGLQKAAAMTPGKYLTRNTPTLTYAGLQRGFFYDLKAGTLEDQALDVVHHKQEMDGSLDEATKRINQSNIYRKEISNAYQNKNGDVDPWKIQHALASYIRSLSPFSSKFDAYMRGDKTQLNASEKKGFNLFMGKARCGSCHFAPIFNGTQAPLFAKSEAEVLGVPNQPDTINARIDTDLGRYTLYNYPQYKYAFKTPTLRNITKTAPYMHNGVYQSLEQVLDFYNRGGGMGIGIHLENQTLSADPLNLTKSEIKNIIAFLHTLEDRN